MEGVRDEAEQSAEEQELGPSRGEVLRLHEKLEAYERVISDKNSRIAGLESRVQEMDTENVAAKREAARHSRPLVLWRSSVFSKLGTFFFFITIITLVLHYAGFLSIPQLFSLFDSSIRQAFAIFSQLLNRGN